MILECSGIGSSIYTGVTLLQNSYAKQICGVCRGKAAQLEGEHVTQLACP